MKLIHTAGIDPDSEQAARAFITKGTTSLCLVSAILFGGSGGDAP